MKTIKHLVPIETFGGAVYGLIICGFNVYYIEIIAGMLFTVI